jgi:hypothetical protein
MHTAAAESMLMVICKPVLQPKSGADDAANSVKLGTSPAAVSCKQIARYAAAAVAAV